jgi:hypothetical protein
MQAPLNTKEFTKLHQCNKNFKYDIYLLGGKVGFLHRKIQWNNESNATNAMVESYGEVSFLWVNSTYQQQSNMQYSRQNNYFLTPSFSQKLTGFKAREMTANMSIDGLSSTVTLNTEVSHYQSKSENTERDKETSIPLYDLDTLGAQIRLNILQGNTHFTLLRQASDKVERYKFEIAGNEMINHTDLGKLKAIKVIEAGEHKNTELWFSASHDYQLVKAQLDMMFSPTVLLSSFSIQCD